MKKTYKAVAVFLCVLCCVSLFASCKGTKATVEIDCVYLGVKNSKKATREDVLSDKNAVFKFKVDGKTKYYCVDCGEDNYTIQNTLMNGYEYRITVKGDKILSARLLDGSAGKGKVSGYTAGEKTVKNFLSCAVSPIGKALYVYGGGWNFEDSGSSTIARTIGLSPTWEKFYKSQDFTYDHKKQTYPDNGWNEYYYAGLDCSGFIGWTLYNTFNTESGKDGFVMPSKKMASTFGNDKKLGSFVHPETKDYAKIIKMLHPGDIISIDGHAYIVLGTCDDGSMIIVHSTEVKSVSGDSGGGVMLSAISINGDEDKSCKAYKLVEETNRKYFPEFEKRYPAGMKPVSLYFDFPEDLPITGIFTWDNPENGLKDQENIRNMSAEQVLETIFS